MINLCAIFGSLSLFGELKDYCHDENDFLRKEMESTNAEENTEKAKNFNAESLAAMIAKMNQTMATMAGNISSMGNALKRMRADTESASNAKGKKTTTAR